MGTSVEIVLLTTIAAVAVICAFHLRILRDRALRRLSRWLRAARAGEWDAVQRPGRWLNPIGAVERLRRGALSNDAEFAARYREVTSGDSRFFFSLAIAALAIALIVIGTRAFGWSY